MPAEHRRVQAARHGAKLVERDGNLAPRPIEPSCRLRVGCQLLLEQAQLQRQRDQPLLCAVVQIALQPLPLLLARFDHPRARALQLLQMRLLLGLQARVLERDPGRRADRGEQLGLIVQIPVVEQRREMSTVSVDQRRRSSTLRVRAA